MEKTYKLTLPQNKEVESTQVRVENGNVFVDVKFKERFEPKDGDFLVIENDVFIYNGKQTEESYGAYVGVLTNGKIDKALTECSWAEKEGCRFATSEEKAEFLKRLEKECHQRWNAEKKCLEDIYVPKFGDILRVELDKSHYRRNYMICIYPDKEFSNTDNFFGLPFLDLNGNLILSEAGGSTLCCNIMLASESEKKELFDKLAEVGKRWNPETKTLEPIRWRAKFGGYYYAMNPGFEVAQYQEADVSTDDNRYNSGNYFQTPEEAQPYVDKVKEMFKNA